MEKTQQNSLQIFNDENYIIKKRCLRICFIIMISTVLACLYANFAGNMSEFRLVLTNSIVVGGEDRLELCWRQCGAVDGAQRAEVFFRQVWRVDAWRSTSCHAEFHLPLQNAAGLFREWHFDIRYTGHRYKKGVN